MVRSLWFFFYPRLFTDTQFNTVPALPISRPFAHIQDIQGVDMAMAYRFAHSGERFPHSPSILHSPMPLSLFCCGWMGGQNTHPFLVLLSLSLSLSLFLRTAQ